MSGRKCDQCGGAVAPFGYGPPPGLGIKVARSLWVCAAPACRAWAKAKVDALAASYDPLASARAGRTASSAPKPPPAADPSQGSLF